MAHTHRSRDYTHDTSTHTSTGLSCLFVLSTQMAIDTATMKILTQHHTWRRHKQRGGSLVSAHCLLPLRVFSHNKHAHTSLTHPLCMLPQRLALHERCLVGLGRYTAHRGTRPCS